MVYPGATSDVKQHLRKSGHVFMYGIESAPVNKYHIKKLDTTQGNLVKQTMKLKTCFHTMELLLSLAINRIPRVQLLLLYSKITDGHT